MELIVIIAMLSLAVVALSVALWKSNALLRLQSAKQHECLMSFHNAGKSMAEWEIRKAETEIARIRAEADRETAATSRIRAERETQKEVQNNGSASRFGHGGRTVAQTAPETDRIV